jgi:Family of unknown function (DUF6152)
VLEAKGVVKEWQWTNPHTWLIMVVDDGKGGKTIRTTNGVFAARG